MPDEPFLMVSLRGEQAKKLANVLTNKSASQILQYLANHEGVTESQMAKDLALPLSTVNYNMKALVDAKLVMADEYHYSARGKEVNHYKLARKYIIIAPDDEKVGFWERMKKYVPVAIAAAATGVVLRALQLFTGTLGMKAASSELAMMAPRTMADGVIEEAVPSAAGAALPEAAPMLAKSAADEAAGSVAEQAFAATAAPLPEPSFWQQLLVGDWIGYFLLGVFVFLLAAMIVEYVRSKK